MVLEFVKDQSMVSRCGKHASLTEMGVYVSAFLTLIVKVCSPYIIKISRRLRDAQIKF